MEIQYYPLIYTASRGLDYNLWISPPNVNQSAVEICRRSMADDLYGISKTPKRLYVKTSDFLLWGVCLNNRFMTALDSYYYTDAFGRPIRGFYGAYIPLSETNGADCPQSLPLDFDDGLPFTQNMLFEPFVQPYWTVGSQSELNKIAPIQNLTLDDEQSIQAEDDFSLSIPQPGFYRGLAPRNDEILNRIFQSIIRSKENVGIVTGIESQTQAKDLAKLFNIQFIERINLSEDSDIEIEPKPKLEPIPESDDDIYDDEVENEESEEPKSFRRSDNRKSEKRARFQRLFRKNQYGSDTTQQDDEEDDSSSKKSRRHDKNDENSEILEGLFERFVRNVWDIMNYMLNHSPGRNNNGQNKPEAQEEKSQPEPPEEQSQPEKHREQAPASRRDFPKPESSAPVKKPFVPSRKIISETNQNSPVDNPSAFPDSKMDSRLQDLINPTPSDDAD